MKKIKWFTIYSISFLGELDIELTHTLTTLDKKEVKNYLEIKNFEIDRPLENDIRIDYFYYTLKNGTRVPNKKIKVEHLNNQYLVVSEFDKDYTKE